MEMERINDNTIRVILGNSDLEDRGITVLDLLGNRDQIESFFYSILEEVDTDHTFANDQTVTFQVLPNKEGLELLISRSPKQSVDANNNGDDLLQSLDYLTEGNARKTEIEDVTSYDPTDNSVQVLMAEFDTFENFVELAQNLRPESSSSDLYKFQGKYYLKLTLLTNELRSLSINDIHSIINEYGKIVKVSSEMLAESGKRIMGQSALELTRYYFND